MEIESILIIIVAIIIILMVIKGRAEGFDLAVGLRQYPHRGKFDDCYQI